MREFIAELHWRQQPDCISAVKADIEAALKHTAAADTQKILVDVEGSDVTLSGTVRNWAERETAMTAAWETPGLRKVVEKMLRI